MIVKNLLIVNQPQIDRFIRELWLETGLTQKQFASTLSATCSTLKIFSQFIIRFLFILLITNACGSRPCPSQCDTVPEIVCEITPQDKCCSCE